MPGDDKMVHLTLKDVDPSKTDTIETIFKYCVLDASVQTSGNNIVITCPERDKTRCREILKDVAKKGWGYLIEGEGK